MKKRWRVELGDDAEYFLIGAWAFWAIVGVVAMALGSIPYHGDVRDWDVVIAILWLLGTVFVPAVATLVLGAKWMRRNVRIRREYVSGPDLRKIASKEDQ